MLIEIISRQGDYSLELLYYLMGAGFECKIADWNSNYILVPNNPLILTFKEFSERDLGIVSPYASSCCIVVVGKLNFTMRDKIFNLAVGDCLEFPSQLTELSIKLRRILQNINSGSKRVFSNVYTCDDMVFSSGQRTLKNVKGVACTLTPAEARILAMLTSRANFIVERSQIERELGYSIRNLQSRGIDVLMSSLRARLMPFSAYTTLHTIRGVGYRLEGPWEESQVEQPSNFHMAG